MMCSWTVLRAGQLHDHADVIQEVVCVLGQHSNPGVLWQSCSACTGQQQVLTYMSVACAAVFADLIDAPGGQRGLVLGVDDELQRPHWRQRLKLPRADLARLAVAAVLLRDSSEWRQSGFKTCSMGWLLCLLRVWLRRQTTVYCLLCVCPVAAPVCMSPLAVVLDMRVRPAAVLVGVLNRSLDCAAKLPKDGAPTTTLDDFKQLFQSVAGSCNYTINDRTSPAAVWACHGHGAAPGAEQQQQPAAAAKQPGTAGGAATGS
jgi:hypothetical protein